MTDWQPIETAPRGGQVLLGWYAGTVSAMCWHKGKYFRCGRINDVKDGWAVHGPGYLAWTAHGKPMLFEPTH